VAAARLGADVTFLTSIGDDAYGQQALAAFQADHINVEHVIRHSHVPTGVALIMVGQDGENMIAVIPGANAMLTPAHILAAEGVIKNADCVLLQLEIPMETVAAAVEVASRHQVHTILNPAPAKSIPASILEKVTTFTPNETEAAQILGVDFAAGYDLPSVVSSKHGIKNILITLGKRGVLLSGSPGRVIPAPIVNAVDTTAAGDAFNGALAFGLARGDELETAVQYAIAVAALSVTRRGAQESLPTKDQVDVFLRTVQQH
jgi:ribokinase